MTTSRTATLTPRHLHLEPLGLQQAHEPLAEVALDNQRAAFARAARAALGLEGLEDGVEFGLGPGEAGDQGGGLAASAGFLAVDADDTIIGDAGARGAFAGRGFRAGE